MKEKMHKRFTHRDDGFQMLSGTATKMDNKTNQITETQHTGITNLIWTQNHGHRS